MIANAYTQYIFALPMPFLICTATCTVKFLFSISASLFSNSAMKSIGCLSLYVLSFIRYQFCVAILVQMYVLGSQVSVDNVTAVQVRESFCHTGSVEMCRGVIKCPPETPRTRDESSPRS